MRILVAPTAYKGSLSPAQVALAMECGIKTFASLSKKEIESTLLPIADGGDGTIEALSLSLGGKVEKTRVSGACNEIREALWLKTDQIAVVELASACGIAGLKKDQLCPMDTHTRGLGTVIAEALTRTISQQIFIAIGGSASTDGGSAALYELGARFFDYDGNLLVPTGGGMLNQIVSCDLSPLHTRIKGRRFKIATDVSSPLLGPMGAAHVFGPQKGASPAQVEMLDHNLAHFADVIESHLDKSARSIPGAGAAGGTGFGLALALNAEIISGFDWLSKILDLENQIRNCDLVISGEGRIDASSLQGKVIGSLKKLCQDYNKPLWFVAGSVASSEVQNLGVDFVQSASDGINFASESDISNCILMSLQKHHG